MSFEDYYQHYLSLHQNKICRRLHLVGWPLGAIVLLLICFYPAWWWTFFLVIPVGYFFAWIGHFFFEGNTPATFKNPILAYMSELRMVWDICTGRLPL